MYGVSFGISSSARLLRGVILSRGAGKLLRLRVVVVDVVGMESLTVAAPTPDFRRGIFEGEALAAATATVVGNGAVTGFIDDRRRFGGIAKNVDDV